MENKMTIGREEELTGDLLLEFISDYEITELPRLNNLFDYYRGKTNILNRTVDNPDKPNNKVPVPFSKFIVNELADYFIGKGVKYEAGIENMELLKEVQSIADKNKDNMTMKTTAVNTGIFGRGYLLNYINEKGEFCYRNVDTRSCFMIYADDLSEDKLYGVRFFYKGSIRNQKLKVEVYSDNSVRYFDETDNGLILTSEDTHALGRIPMLETKATEYEEGDFEEVQPLMDGYDKAISGEINEKEIFEANLLVFTGIPMGEEGGEGEDGMPVDGANSKRRTNAMFLPEGGSASILTKTMDVSYVKDHREMLEENILKFCNVPNRSKLQAGNQISGKALEIHYAPMENKVQYRETSFEEAIRERLEMISAYLSIKTGTSIDTNAIEFTIQRNKITAESELIDNANKVFGKVSNSTYLGMLPPNVVDDVAEEQRKLKEEQESAGLYAGLVGEDEDLLNGVA